MRPRYGDAGEGCVRLWGTQVRRRGVRRGITGSEAAWARRYVSFYMEVKEGRVRQVSLFLRANWSLYGNPKHH